MCKTSDIDNRVIDKYDLVVDIRMYLHVVDLKSNIQSTMHMYR